MPGAAESYEQTILDLSDAQRRSYRGVAHELREVLRETVNYLAPDNDVVGAPGFEPEPGTKRPTQRQKALYVFRRRNLTNEEGSAPELSLSLVEELIATITRNTYSRGARDAHTLSSVAEVRQLKMWIDAVLGELLQIHKGRSSQPPRSLATDFAMK